MHLVSLIVWLLADGCILSSSLADDHHSDIEEEDDHCHDAVANDSAVRNICAAHRSGLHESKTTVNDTCQDDSAAKPLMDGAQCAPASVSVVV